MKMSRPSFVRWSRVILFAIACALVAVLARGEEKKKDDKKETPKVLLISPFSVIGGKPNTLRIRGLKLAEAIEVHVEAAGVPIPATIKEKGKVEPIKPFDAAKTGDTRIVLELNMPEGIAATELSIVVVTKAGNTEPRPVLVLNAATTIEEKEPNGGFREAQEIKWGQTLRGTISDSSDVDVFKFQAKSGQRIVAEVDAARHGSPLDSLLTLYDDKGHELASNDDSEVGADSILQFKIPSDGVYLLCLSDANGVGSEAHGYLLHLRDASATTQESRQDRKDIKTTEEKRK